jgi:glycosyltransferase involved in cell wall biosynthesis
VAGSNFGSLDFQFIGGPVFQGWGLCLRGDWQYSQADEEFKPRHCAPPVNSILYRSLWAHNRLMAVSVSLCMIVKNEAINLPVCLDSVRGLVSELIVVDTGSTDDTPDIASRYGAEVVRFDFTVVDFAAARNYALARAQGPWILVLDADEVLDTASIPLIEALVARDENSGYFLERHNRRAGSEKTIRDFVVRLFPNRPQYRYQGRVHETIDASILNGGGQLLKSGARIDHNFSSDPEARRRKNHWYIEILKEEIAADPGDGSRLSFLATEYHQMEMFDEATEAAERLAVLRPLDAKAHLFAGVYHLLYKPDLRKARADFNRALILRPGYPEAESFLRDVDGRERASHTKA